MEPKMINLKILSTAAVVVLALAVPTASFAQSHSARGGGVRAGGGAGFHGAAAGARFSGGGGGFRGGYGNRGGGGFFPGAVAGAVIGGALASNAYYGGPGYYAPGYYDDQYDNDGPVAVVQGPGGGGDDTVAYCMQTYRSYDPRSGTYVGYDGLRHPCP
jgi:hypothetical protein